MAYINVLGLTKDNLQERNGVMWICTKRHKTNIPVNVRLLDVASKIIEKYQGQTKGDKLLPISSNQKINEYLKELGTIYGIDKELSYHQRRHTFSTTVTLSNGVPIETVSKMLGHTSIKTTQIYARIVDEKISHDMEILAQKLGNISTPTSCATAL